MIDDDAPPSSDRRRAVRRVACFPGLVERGGDDTQTTAMIADLAESGALLLLRKPDWQVDDTLRLELFIALDDDKEPRIAMGQVVRIQPLPDERVSLWTHQVGVEFHTPIELSDEEIEALEKRQEPYGKRQRG